MVGIPVVLCLLASGHVGAPSKDPASPHVRAIDPRAQAWITAGQSGSRTFLSLIDRLERSDVIVYVQIVDRIEGGAAGQMYFVTSTATARYVRIEIVADGDAREMAALLGHELQHAVEVAEAPHVRDRDSLAILYLIRGRSLFNRTEFDSLDARVTEERVRSEMSGARGVSTGAPLPLARLHKSTRVQNP